MHLTILAWASDEFQKSWKILIDAIFLKMCKKLSEAEFQLFGVFQVS